MARVIDQRMTAKIEGDFVVFLIGMRINKFWKLRSWLPVARAMPRMLSELDRLPSEETGFLGHNGLSFGAIVQYWRSFDHLEAYAKSNDHQHYPAWVAFNKKMKQSRGDVGIWHETFLVNAGQYETVYSGMPLYGLGKAAESMVASRNQQDARSRLSG